MGQTNIGGTFSMHQNDQVVQLRGTIYEKGWGMLSQKVMRDPELSRDAKAIYAYLCSFAWGGADADRKAFPSIKQQCQELGFKSEDTYYKKRKELLLKGYITIEKQRSNEKGDEGKFANNIYYIEAVPVPKTEEEVNAMLGKTKKQPYPKKSGTAPYPNSPSTAEPDTVEPDTVKWGTNNTSIKDNHSLKIPRDKEYHHQGKADDGKSSQSQLSESEIDRLYFEWTSEFGVRGALSDDQIHSLVQSAIEGLTKEYSLDQITSEMIVDYILYTIRKIRENDIKIRTTAHAAVCWYLKKNIQWHEQEEDVEEVSTVDLFQKYLGMSKEKFLAMPWALKLGAIQESNAPEEIQQQFMGYIRG